MSLYKQLWLAVILLVTMLFVGSFAITSSMRGTFQSDPKTRSEFTELIRHRKESFA